MASSSSPTPPLDAPPPPPPPPPPPLPPFPLHDDTTLAPEQPPPLAWAFPSAPLEAPLWRASAAAAGFTPPPAACTVCGKRFPSRKALHGHMRCHPERPYRGMTPPPPPPQFLRHEAGGGAPALPAADDEFTEPDREVAGILIMMSAGPAKGKGKKRLRLGGSPSCGKKEAGGASASATERNDDHKCGVCHRGFATGKALGGHKGSHMEKPTCGADDQAVVPPATSRSRSVLAAPEEETKAAATALDLNLPPPGPPVPQKNGDQGGSNNAMLDLKLGY